MHSSTLQNSMVEMLEWVKLEKQFSKHSLEKSSKPVTSFLKTLQTALYSKYVLKI